MSTTIPPNNNTGLYNSGIGQPANVNTSISITGNIYAGGYISAAGNIGTATNLVSNAVYTNNYFYANGSPFTGGYANANVAAYLQVYGGNANISSVFHNTTGVAVQSNAWAQLQYTNSVPGPADQTQIGTGSWFYVDSSGAAFESNTTGALRSISFSNSGDISAFGNIAVGNSLSVNGNLNIGGVLGVQTLSVAGNIIGVGGISMTGNVTVPNITATFNGTFNSLTVNNTANLNSISMTGAVNLANTLTGTFAIQQNSNNRTGLRIIASANNASSFAATTTLYSTSNVANAAALALQVSTTEVRLITSGIGNVTTLPLKIYNGANLSATFDLANNFAVTGNITAVGNIAGTYFIGNGSQLTGITAGTNYSNANVAAYLPTFTGNITANVISTTGNIYSAGNISTAGAVTSSTVGASGLVQGGSINTPGNLTAGNISTAGTVNLGNTQINGNLSVTGNVIITNTEIVNQTITTVGNITGGNILTANTISAGGNITGGNITTIGQITATGNVAGSYFIGNGSQLTGLPASYSNANVAAYLPTFTGNLTAGNVSVAGLVQAANANFVNYVNNLNMGTNYIFSNLVASIGAPSVCAVGTVQGGNLVTPGLISAVGNITGNYFIGNGSQLTGITAGTNYSNANVAAFLPTYSGDLAANNFSTTGNVLLAGFANMTSNITLLNNLLTGTNYIYSNLVPSGGLAGLPAICAVGGVQGGNLITPGYVTAVGTVTGGNLITSGTLSVTGTATFGDTQVNGNLSVTGNVTITNTEIVNQTITTVGNITAGNLLTANTVSAGGNIQVGGLVSATGNVRGGNINTAGAISATGDITTAGNLSVTGGFLRTSNTIGYIFNTTATTINIGSAAGNINFGATTQANFAGNISAVGNIAGTYFIGNGSLLTGITAGSTYSNANVAAYLPTYSGDLGSVVNITASGNVIGAVISSSGNVSVANVLNFTGTGNVPNIYLGTSGNLFITSNSTGTNRLRIVGSANNTGANGVVASFYHFANTANTPLLQIQTANTEMRIASSAIGSVSALPLNFYVGNALSGGFDTSTNFSVQGNISAGNIQGPNASTSVGLLNYKDTASVLTYAATITPNIALGSIQTVTLTGNVTFNAYGGTPQAGQSLTLIVLQDSTGNRVLTSTMKFAGGAKTLSTAANAADIIYSFYDGTNYYATLSRAYQ